MAALPALASSLVRGVEIRSNVTPTVTVDPFSESAPEQSGGALGDFLLRLVKPAVYVQTPSGIIPLEPWGKPTPGMFPVVALGAAVLAVVAGYYGVRLVRRKL